MARPRQSWWQGARSLSLCAMDVAATTAKPAAAEACVCACYSHDSLTLTGVYRLEPRRRGDVQLLGINLRWHGLQGIGLRGSHRGSTGCNLFRDEPACVARERARQSRPLSPRVSTAVREVVFAVSRGALGLVVGGPIDLRWTGRVLWAMLWR